MKRLAIAGFLTCVLLVTGCGKMTGQWTLDCITPESERQSFDLKCLVLNDDNTFVLRANEEAKAAEMSGTYCYDKDTKTLTFTPEKGAPRSYIAQVELNGDMKVCPTGQATWTAYLKKYNCEKCERTCAKPCAKTCAKPCAKNPPCQKKAAECPMHKLEPVKVVPGQSKN